MAEYKFYVKALPGFVILQKLAELIPAAFKQNLAFSCETNVGRFSAPQQGHVPADALVGDVGFQRAIVALEGRPGTEITSLRISSDASETLAYYDKQNEDGPHFKFSSDSSDRPLAVFDVLAGQFELLRRTEAAYSKLPEEQRESLKVAEQIIQDFSAQAARLSQAATKQAEDVARLLREKTEEVDKRFLDKERELEARYKEKTEEIERREKEHAETVKAFELRNNTVVRRDLLEKLRGIIAEQKEINLSSNTVRKRRMVHVVCAVTMLASATLAGLFAWKVLSGESPDWRYFLPLSAGTLLFVSTGIFYVKWNDQWFRDHAAAEFQNRKFGADILRASWIAELFFEWESKKEKPFPPELLQGFARGLFSPDSGRGGSLHPFDELATVVKDFQSIRVGKTGIEVTKAKTEK